MCTKMSAPACLAQREHWTPCRVTCECACMRACACERARAFARVRACAVVKPYPSGPIPDVLARPHVEAPIICGNLRGVLIILLQSIKKSSDDINHTHSKSNSTNSNVRLRKATKFQDCTSCMVSPAQLTVGNQKRWSRSKSVGTPPSAHGVGWY